MSATAAARWPGELRPYQEAALRRLTARWAGGDTRAWVTLPPGAGKTLVGLEAARRLGRRTVVFAPNTAIQGQWTAHWHAFERPEGCTAGTSRTLTDDVTVLTYQSLAVFDPDAETDEDGRSATLLGRLHGNGAALVRALHDAGPLTVVLDECHHLLQLWGRLLAEVLAELDDAHVIGLTGTPATQLGATEAELVQTLFGDPVHGASIPALVRDGYLAPFAELAWLTEPTPVERDYINGQGLRFAELCTDLMAPGFADTDFLTWLRLRFTDRTGPDGAPLGWAPLAAQEPALTDAVLRLHHAGASALPPGARMLERHRHPPRAEDWMALVGDYVAHCLRPAADSPGNAEALARIRAALPAVGYQLTKRGVRAGRSPVDRVLARSAAKSRGAVEVVAAESASLGPQLRALVLCDHERATARPSARLRTVLADDAGSAWEQVALLAADERTRGLGPILVTGRTVAAAPETAEAFAAWVREAAPGLAPAVAHSDGAALARVEARWSSRTWVRLVTGYFESGGCRVLVGTRALLGEGWDARGVNTVVDLTTATTPTAVVQGRGRALRLDPERPDKTAHTWTVVCVSEEHPKGAADWDRFVRKHEGYLGVDAEGEVTSGVAHIDPGFSPYEPPPAARFDAVNARMLARAEDRPATRERWRIGRPYTDELLPTLRVIPTRPAARSGGPDHDVDPGPRRPPAAVPAESGIAPAEPLPRRPVPVSVAAALLVCAAVLGLLPLAAVPVLPALLAAAVLAPLSERGAARVLRVRAAARLVGAAAGPPDVTRIGYAVADALRAAGRSGAGAEAVRVHVDADGAYRLMLAGAGPAAAADFRTALEETLAPLTGTPRYLVARYEIAPPAPDAARRLASAWLRGRAPANPAAYHAVPSMFGRNRKSADAFAAAWSRWVCATPAVFTQSQAGRELLHAHYATTPYPSETAARLTWS